MEKGPSAPRKSTRKKLMQISSLKNTVDPHSEEEALKQFDVDLKYGPCIGLTRAERWERAKELGLDPPFYVMQIIHDHPDMNKSLWSDLLKEVLE